MWLYKEKEIYSLDDIDVIDITEMEGFVYKITHIPTNKFYIGKKSFWSTRNVKIGKREKEKLQQEKKENGDVNWWTVPQKKKVKKESDWMSYYSSNDWIKDQVKNGKKDEFSREILEVYNTKKKLTYYELYWQFKYDVLADESSLNFNLLGKFYKSDIIT